VLDLLTSKLAMMIAALIILTSVLGIYAYQREQAKDLELRNIADTISGAIDDFNALLGESKVNVTFDRDGQGIYIQPKVDGKSYDILITKYKVIISQESRRFYSNYAGSIHLWIPQSDSYNQTEIEDCDSEFKMLELVSGDTFQIERKLLEIDNEKEYGTFIYV
jgi:hypothetical protein